MVAQNGSWICMGAFGHMGGILKRNPKHLPMDCAWLHPGDTYIEWKHIQTKDLVGHRSVFDEFASLMQLRNALNKFFDNFFSCIKEHLEKYV